MEIVSGVEVRQRSKGRGCLQPSWSYKRYPGSTAQPILTNFVTKRRAWKNVAGLNYLILHNLLYSIEKAIYIYIETKKMTDLLRHFKPKIILIFI